MAPKRTTLDQGHAQLLVKSAEPIEIPDKFQTAVATADEVDVVAESHSWHWQLSGSPPSIDDRSHTAWIRCNTDDRVM